MSGTRAERYFRGEGFDQAFEQYWQAATVGRTRQVRHARSHYASMHCKPSGSKFL